MHSVGKIALSEAGTARKAGITKKKIDIYTARDNLVGNISSAMLDRVSVFTSGASYLGTEVNKDFLHRDITGYINHCFSAWSRSLPVGIINTTDGKKFSVATEK